MEIELAQLTQECGKLVLAVQVRAVARDILRDDDEFLHARGRKLARLVQKFVHRAAAVTAAQARNDAVGTAVVAALSDAQIRVPRRRGQNARAALHAVLNVAHVAGAQATAAHHLVDREGDLAVAAGAEHRVDLRQLMEHIVLVALRHAAGDDDLFELALFFELRHL